MIEVVETRQDKEAALERLTVLEGQIVKGLDTFREVGNALIEISEYKLYLLRGFKNFPDYLAEKWGFNKTTAYNKMYASRAVQILEAADVPSLPQNESVAKMLSKLLRDPDKLVGAWAAVLRDGPPTTQTKVRNAVNAQLTGIKPEGRPTEVKCPECGHVFPAKGNYAR